MSKCIKCGAEIPEGMSFCPQCGTAQSQAGAEQQAGPEVTPQEQAYQQQAGPQQQYQQQGGPQQQQYQQQAGPQQQQYQQQGGPQQQYQQQQQQQQNSGSGWSRPTTIYQYRKDPQYSLSNKAAGVLCYVGWIGLIITLCMGDQKDPFVKFHMNYGLLYSIGCFICTALQFVNAIPVIGQLISIVLFIAMFGIFVLDIIGLIEALDMKCTERPYLENIKLIK